MKKFLPIVLAFSGAVLFGHNLAHAQSASTPTDSTQASQASIDQEVDLLRKDVRSQKKQLIAANLPLTDSEAQAFWPVYDQYTAELAKTNDTKYQLIKEYAASLKANNVTDAQADDWAKRLLKLDQDVAALRMKYLPSFRKVLPAKKTGLFLQVERTSQLLIDLQVAAQIPLIQP